MAELVQVQGLFKTFYRTHRTIQALRGIDLQVSEGECVAIVGESGCGKSTLAKVLVGLEEPTAGAVSIGGLQLGKADRKTRQRLARLCQMVFQDPHESLNPRMKVYQAIEEPLRIHQPNEHERRERRVYQLLSTVGLSREHGSYYPHQLSGGQRQRVGIARALALSPKVLIADEPVSALDVSLQAQILNLLMQLRKTLGLTLIVVSHNLQVVRWLSDRVVVMYEGQVVEMAETKRLFARPSHPYTQLLMEAAPKLGAPLIERRIPSVEPLRLGAECAFRPRCPIVQPHCRLAEPILDGQLHRVACFEALSDLP